LHSGLAGTIVVSTSLDDDTMQRANGIVARARIHIQQRGVKSFALAVARRMTVKQLTALEEFLFDAARGTETRRLIEVDELSFDRVHAAAAYRYEPTKRDAFRRLMRTITPPVQARFVDVGCGKGRAVLLAIEHGFERVAGIELSSQLCVIARRNVAAYQSRTKRTAQVEIIEGDAAEYVPAADDCVFYLFNPFGRAVLSRLVANIVQSCERHPRKVWLVYCNPRHRDVIDEEPRFTPIATLAHRGTRFLVYVNAGDLAPGR
jgi:SAM-dependent methyltransferase